MKSLWITDQIHSKLPIRFSAYYFHLFNNSYVQFKPLTKECIEKWRPTMSNFMDAIRNRLIKDALKMKPNYEQCWNKLKKILRFVSLDVSHRVCSAPQTWFGSVLVRDTRFWKKNMKNRLLYFLNVVDKYFV